MKSAGTTNSRDGIHARSSAPKRSVSSAAPTRNIAFGAVIDAVDLFAGLVVRRDKDDSPPFTVRQIEIREEIARGKRGKTVRVVRVFVNGSSKGVAEDARYILVSNPADRARDGREGFAGPRGHTYGGAPRITNAVREAMSGRKTGASVPDYVSEFAAERVGEAVADYWERYEREYLSWGLDKFREQAGPKRVTPVVKSRWSNVSREYKPRPDPAPYKRPYIPEWSDFIDQ